MHIQCCQFYVCSMYTFNVLSVKKRWVMINYRNYWLTPQKLSSWIEIRNIPERVRRHICQIGMSVLVLCAWKERVCVWNKMELKGHRLLKMAKSGQVFLVSWWLWPYQQVNERKNHIDFHSELILIRISFNVSSMFGILKLINERD